MNEVQFGSKSLTGHLVRGAVGIAGLWFAISPSLPHSWLSPLALLVALLAFRGCPTCWLMGLIETVGAKARGKPAPDVCTDGSCARPRHVP